jgi:Tol biopolymer transport system component
MNRSSICLMGIPLVLGAPIIHSAGADQAISLTDGMPAGRYLISPDESRLIFESAEALYSARMDGVGAPVRISAGEQIFYLYDSRFSPDSSWLVYKSHEVSDDVRRVQIYSSRADGSGTPVLLSSTIDEIDPGNGHSVAPQITLGVSADSRYVAMRVGGQDSSFDLLSRPIDGSAAAISLSNGVEVGPFETGGQTSGGRVAGNRVLFSGNDSLPTPLYSGVFDGSAPAVPLGDPTVTTRAFAVSPDLSKVALATTAGTTQSLYITPVEGGPLTLLASAQDEFAFSPQYIGGMKFSPDGGRVVYRKGETIWSVRSDGSAPAVEIVPNRDGWASWHLDVSPEGKSIAYTRLPPPDNSIDLYTSPIDGDGPATHLWGKVDGHLDRIGFAPDGKHLLFQELRPFGGGNWWFLWTAPTDGSKPAVELGAAFQYQVMPDGQSVIIAQDLNKDFLIEGFYQIPIEGGEPRLVVANPFPDGGIDAFSAWQLIDNGSKIVFTARDAGYHFEIFVAAIPEPAGLFLLLVGGVTLLAKRRWRLNLQ